MRQFISGGISVKHWLAGKALAYASLSLIFLLPLFFVALLLALFSHTAFTPDIALRLTLLFVLYFIYSLVWVAIVIGISSLTSRSQTVLACLVGIWLVTAIILPRFLSAHALATFDYPSRAQFEIQLVEATAKLGDSHNPADPHFAQFKAAILTEYGVERIEDLPVNYAGLVMAEGERLSAQVYAEHHGHLIHQFEQQDRLINYFAAVNPYLFARKLSMQLAASDSHHFYHFEQESENYRYQMIQKLNHLHAHNIDYAHNKTQKLPADYWRNFASFDYQTPTLSWSMNRADHTWFGVLVWLFIPALFLLFCSRRIRIYATT